MSAAKGHEEQHDETEVPMRPLASVHSLNDANTLRIHVDETHGLRVRDESVIIEQWARNEELRSQYKNKSQLIVTLRLNTQVSPEYRLTDKFLWDLHQSDLSTLEYAQQWCADEGYISMVAVHVVHKAIEEELSAWRANIANAPPLVEERLCSIQVEVRVGSLLLQDQLEWDVNNSSADIGALSRSVATDLGLTREAETDLHFALLEQVLDYRYCIRRTQCLEPLNTRNVVRAPHKEGPQRKWAPRILDHVHTEHALRRKQRTKKRDAQQRREAQRRLQEWRAREESKEADAIKRDEDEELRAITLEDARLATHIDFSVARPRHPGLKRFLTRSELIDQLENQCEAIRAERHKLFNDAPSGVVLRGGARHRKRTANQRLDNNADDVDETIEKPSISDVKVVKGADLSLRNVLPVRKRRAAAAVASTLNSKIVNNEQQIMQ